MQATKHAQTLMIYAQTKANVTKPCFSMTLIPSVQETNVVYY